MPARRAHTVHHIGSVSGIVLDAGLRALQPMVPPAQRFLQEADGWTGPGIVRVFVDPRAHNALDWRLDVGDEMRDRVAVAVMPAADGQHGCLDGRKILADRATLPVGVAMLVPQP